MLTMYKHGAKVEPQTKATVRCSARPIIGLKETDSLSMDKVLEKLGKYPVWNGRGKKLSITAKPSNKKYQIIHSENLVEF